MERRTFLQTLSCNACLILGTSTVAPATSATRINSLGVINGLPIKTGGHLVTLRYDFNEFEEDDLLCKLWAKLSDHAMHPFLRSSMNDRRYPIPRHFEALVELPPEAGGEGVGALLDIWQFGERGAGKILSFAEWINKFRPVSRDDWLMALPLYRHYRIHGRVISTVQATPDPWLDAMLRSTRGMLIWRHQWIEFIRMAGDTGTKAATQMVMDCVMNRPSAYDLFRRKIYSATGQTMMQIIEERGHDLQLIGHPDYLTGEWLHRYVS